jgi:hypothetical protein
LIAHRRPRRIAALCVALVTASALAGCAFTNGEALPTLERERTASDVLPPALASQLDINGTGGVDPDTVRLAGEYEGADIYISRGNDDREVCLVIFVEADNWGSSCNISRDFVLSTQGAYSVRLTFDGVVPEDDGPWVALTDDVLARKMNSIDEGPQG